MIAQNRTMYHNRDMENANTLAERVKLARKLQGLSQAELARRLGTGQSTIASIENGRNQGSGYLIHIAGALGVNSSWLATGEGEMNIPEATLNLNKKMHREGRVRHYQVKIGGALLRQEQVQQTGSLQDENILTWENAEDLPPDENRVWIDRYDLMCSAGDGIAQWEVRQKSALPFTKDFFRAIGSRPDDCRLAITRGDSMEPYLFDGDMIMIDMSKTLPRDGHIYAVCFEDEMLVKQIFKQTGGALTLHSYNARYPDRTVPATEETNFHIVGQIIYRSGSGFPAH